MDLFEKVFYIIFVFVICALVVTLGFAIHHTIKYECVEYGPEHTYTYWSMIGKVPVARQGKTRNCIEYKERE